METSTKSWLKSDFLFFFIFCEYLEMPKQNFLIHGSNPTLTETIFEDGSSCLI